MSVVGVLAMTTKRLKFTEQTPTFVMDNKISAGAQRIFPEYFDVSGKLRNMNLSAIQLLYIQKWPTQIIRMA